MSGRSDAEGGAAERNGLRAAVPEWILVAAVLAVAAALRFSAIGLGASWLSVQPDERFYNVTLPTALSWSDLNPHRFYYPSLLWYLFFLVDRLYFRLGRELGLVHVKSLRALFAAAPVPFFVLNRAVSAAFGTATVALTYRLGRRLDGGTTGALAAAFLAVAFLHVRDSTLATVDVTATFFVVASLLGSAGVLQDGDRRSYVLAAVAAGLAAATKYNAAIVAVSLAFAELARFRGAAGESSAVPLRRLACAAVLSSLVFVASNPFLVLDWREARADLLWELAYQNTGQYLDMGRGWYYHLATSLPAAVGWPMFGLALAAMVGTVLSRDVPGLVVVAFAAVFFAVMGHSRAVFVRYMVPLVPVACLFAARAVRAAARTAPARWWRVTAGGVLATLAAAAPLEASIAWGRIVRHLDTRVEAYEFVRGMLGGAPVASYGPPVIWTSTLPGLGVVHYEKGRSESWSDVVRRAHADGVRYFLTHDSPLDLFSPALPDLDAALAASGTPIAEFDFADPARQPRPCPRYDVVDGFYFPIAGFSGVERPGPRIRVYRLD